MNKVTGKILLENTATGIPNLLVTVYDIDPNFIAQSAVRTNATNLVTQFWEHIQGDRLGSVLTDGDGAFVMEGYRYHVVRSSDGGVAQRWVLLHSEPRQPQAQRTVDTQLLKHSAQAVKAFKQLCRTTVACAAEAQQARATFAQSVPATFVAQSTVRPIPHDAKRGRPGQGTPPDQIVYQLDGPLAMQIATRQAHIDQHSGFILATNALNATRVSAPELFAG